MSQYRNVSHIYVSRIWQRRPTPPPQIHAVISAALAGCCRMEIQRSAAQMGEAAASAPQKRLVCFNADKADIFRGVLQTMPMKEQSPIWQRGPSEILSVMLNQNSRDKTRHVCISALITAAPPISKTSPRRRGLQRGKQKHFFFCKHLCGVTLHRKGLVNQKWKEAGCLTIKTIPWWSQIIRPSSLRPNKEGLTVRGHLSFCARSVNQCCTASLHRMVQRTSLPRF